MNQQAGVASRRGRPTRATRAVRTGAARPALRPALPWTATLLLVGLAVPLFLHLGPLRLAPYRLVLIAALVPCLAGWLAGRAGRPLAADFCVLGIGLWSMLSFAVLHGPGVALETGGIGFLETVGPYFLARATIRSPEAFHAMVRLLFGLVLAILPAALWEALTGRPVLLELFGALGPTLVEARTDPRLGLDRVQGPFDHPISYGVFCGAIIGLVYFVLGHGRSRAGRLWRPAAAALAAGFSLSAGPLLAIVSQSALIGWERALHRLPWRWWLFAGLAGSAYVAIDLLSNRTPIRVFASYLTFSARTAYDRINIWTYGTRSILDHPVVGIGLGDWQRPAWMSPSVDMFWILPAMRHGVPVWVLYFAAFFGVVVAVARRRGLDRRLAAYRAGWLVSMAGLFLVGWTVHFWNATLVLFLFLLGSGAWLVEARPASDPTAPVPRRRRSLL